MRNCTRTIAALVVVVFAGAICGQGRGNPTEWPTTSGDAQRTSWVRADGNISPESMSGPGFELQWKTRLESPARHGVSLTPGVVTSAVNLFTPVSTLAGPANQIFSLDNDTGNLFWTRRFDGAIGAGTPACPGGISGAPTRIANLNVPPPGPTRAGGPARGSQSYSSAVGEPGAGVPIAPRAGGGGRGVAAPPAGAPAAGARGNANAPVPPPPSQAPASPFPTNPQAVAAAGGAGGNLFRSSGVVYVVSADGMFRTLGLVSGKDVQRPAPFLPAGARFSDLIGVRDMVYTATSQNCGGAPNGVWAIKSSGDPKTVVSWQTHGSSPIGSIAFTASGIAIVATGPGPTTAGDYANAIVALDPATLALKDWFAQPGVEFAAAPVLFQEDGRDVIAATTKDARVLLLDAASLGGANHATPLFASASLTAGAVTPTAQSAAMWQERGTDGVRWLLVPTTGSLIALKVSQQAGAFSVQPGWVSSNITAPIAPIVVNGVVFVASGPASSSARLYALDGVTGKTLWQSGTTIGAPLSGHSLWTGSGQVYLGTLDGTVYAFGFAMERK